MERSLGLRAIKSDGRPVTLLVLFLIGRRLPPEAYVRIHLRLKA